ncbi:MAG: polyprenyl synthetase family protein [Rhodanobacteraceae bacterium]
MNHAVTTESVNAGDFAMVRTLASADMAAVDALIRMRLASDVALINAVGEHIVGGGGKRLRPMLHVLAARAAGYAGKEHIQLAAVIEFIHTATLLHDDVVDGSDLRRGRKTANNLWGNAASVLVGDFLYSRAFQLMVEPDRLRVMRILADTTNAIAEGEVLQLLNLGNADTDETAYLRVIERKTAVLFAAATQLGAVLAGLDQDQENALREYGLQLGFAFQIADDLLDYVSDARTIGKNIGDDLAEGKPTLPLIYAIERSAPAQASMLRDALRDAGQSDRPSSLEAIVTAIRESGAIDRVRARAIGHADAARAALASLPLSLSRYRDALDMLPVYAVERDH